MALLRFTTKETRHRTYRSVYERDCERLTHR